MNFLHVGIFVSSGFGMTYTISFSTVVCKKVKTLPYLAHALMEFNPSPGVVDATQEH